MKTVDVLHVSLSQYEDKIALEFNVQTIIIVFRMMFSSRSHMFAIIFFKMLSLLCLAGWYVNQYEFYSNAAF